MAAALLSALAASPLGALAVAAAARPLLALAAAALAMALYRTLLEARAAARAPPLRGWAAHRAEAARVRAQFARFLAERAPGTPVSLQRSRGGEADSNRTIASDYKRAALRVDVSRLDGVVGVDHARMLLHVEPGLPMDELARVAIAHGLLPLVVLEFPGITVGGAVAGGGIESSSHKWGSFFDTVEEVDCVTGDGRFLERVSRDSHADLFHALSASYGTQAIVTRVAVRCERAPAFVHVSYVHCDGMPAATRCMEALAGASGAGAGSPPDFIDGVALAADSAVVVVGRACDAPPPGVPRLSLRGARGDPWFFWHLASLARSLPAVSLAAVEDAEDAAAGAPSGTGAGAGAAPPLLAALAGRSEFVAIDDYLFRFDRGAFWMARHGLQVFWGAAAWREAADAADAGPAWWVRVLYSWLATTRQLYRMLHRIGDVNLGRSYIVQDLIMPSSTEACALAAFTGDTAADAAGAGAGEGRIDIWPLWVCPVRMVAPRHAADAGFGFPVQATRAGGLMFNVGVYGLPNGGRPFCPVALNTALERRASELGGRKMLYAQSFYAEAEFWELFDRAAYDAARAAYGGGAVFPCISQKLLLGPARLAKMRGRRRVADFVGVLPALFAWFGGLWLELLLPRALHAPLGIRDGDGVVYERVAEREAPAGDRGAGGGAVKVATPVAAPAGAHHAEDMPGAAQRSGAVAAVARLRVRAASRAAGPRRGDVPASAAATT